MSIFDILNLRTRFEEITYKRFSLPSYSSDINSLRWFIRNGRRRNGLRDDFDEAMTIAKTIVRECDGQSRQKRSR